DWQTGQLVQLDGGTLAEELLPTIANNPSMRPTRLYQNYTAPAWSAGVLPEFRQAVLDSLKKGYGFSVHIGHGYRTVMSVGDANPYRWMQQSLLLLGDPELRMWTGTPRTLTVVAPPSFALDDTAMSVTVTIAGTPLGNARVTLYKAGDALRSGLTNASGFIR